MSLQGEGRWIAPGELFFSITDRQGRIVASNSVFERLSAYGRDELMGAPHNIIRHPEMPGGAFHLMWDTLLSGRPFAAYVRNLAKDRVPYDVFATVTPLGDGFLSVRSAPQSAALRAAAYDLYAEVAPLERERRDEGASAAAAAAHGAEQLAARLAALGFASYDEFMYSALPTEVVARVAVSGPRRPSTDPGTVGRILAAALDIDSGLVAAMDRLDALERLVESLRAASCEASTTASELLEVTRLADVASQRVEASAPVLRRTTQAMTSLVGGLTVTLTALSGELTAVRLAVMEQRFLIALARLHNDMVILFAQEVLQGRAPQQALGYVRALCETLSDDLSRMADAAEATSRRLGLIRQDVDRAREELEGYRVFLSTWRIQVPRYGVARQVGPHVGPIDSHLRRGHDRIADLRALAQQCEANATPVDTGELVGPVWRILESAGAAIGGWRP
ncbi:PAS domain-containing protein [Xylanimonas ulmi]|nr:PAS domain-containing protein [Xylanibacterium ulmi]